MPQSTLRIITDWRIKGSVSDVAGLLNRIESWPLWWGSVYRSVKAEGDGSFAVRSKGLLPLGLRWSARIVEDNLPYRWVVEASGDLHGRGIWNLRQAGDVVEVEYDWHPAGLPLIAGLSSASHRRAMATGYSALCEELARRHRVAA